MQRLQEQAPHGLSSISGEKSNREPSGLIETSIIIGSLLNLDQVSLTLLRQDWHPISTRGKIMKKRTLHLALLLLLMGTTIAQAANWPQFRGPNRDGKSAETALLNGWPAGGPKMLWSVSGLGAGFSSAAVADGLLYITGMGGPKKEGILYAFDLQGKLRWKQSYGPEWSGSYPGARTTPTVDGDRLYVMSGMGRLSCFQAKTGKPIWEVDTLAKFGGANIRWGIAESVLVDGKLVFCTPGGKNSSVVALNKLTGETVWTSKGLSEPSAYCSPVVMQQGPTRLLVTMTAKSIVGLNASNGKLLWQVPHQTSWDISAVSPLLWEGSVHITNGYGLGSLLLKLSPDGNSIKQGWTDKNLDCHHGGVVLVNGSIHGANDNGAGGNRGSWICLDANTGKLKYSARLVGKGSGIYADGKLWMYGENGKVGVARIKPNGYDLLGSFDISMGDGQHWAHPSISGGILFIRHGDVLMAFDVRGK